VCSNKDFRKPLVTVPLTDNEKHGSIGGVGGRPGRVRNM
jgi:hypothetical protein